jgi:hypothetical protein
MHEMHDTARPRDDAKPLLSDDHHRLLRGEAAAERLVDEGLLMHACASTDPVGVNDDVFPDVRLTATAMAARHKHVMLQRLDAPRQDVLEIDKTSERLAIHEPRAV